MGHLGWSLEDQKVKKQGVESMNWVHEVSADNEDFVRVCVSGHLCCILVKNLIVFYLCSENLSNTKFKSNGICCLVEEISRMIHF